MAALEAHTSNSRDVIAQIRPSLIARAGVTLCFLAAAALLVSGLIGNAQSSKLSITPGVIETSAQGM